MDKAEHTKQLSPQIERVAMQRARDKANLARWGLNVVIFLFAVLIIIIILVSQGIGTDVVGPLAIFGLATVWLMGWRRWSQLYQRFYAEELSRMEKPTKETIAFLSQFSSEVVPKIWTGC